MIRWERKLLVVTRHIRFRRIRQVEWTDDWRRWAGEVVLGGAREAGWFSFKVFEYRGKE
jgi:hypothetical protein